MRTGRSSARSPDTAALGRGAMNERDLRKLQLFNAHVRERLSRIQSQVTELKPIRAENDRLSEENLRSILRLKKLVRGVKSSGGEGR